MLERKLSVVESSIININNSIVKGQCDFHHIAPELSVIFVVRKVFHSIASK